MTADSDSPLARYLRQTRFAPLGQSGQEKLIEAAALVCGIGALGSMAAMLLARAGVGRLRLVDRDFVELQNLQRQVLFDEQDAAAGAPKAIAAAEKLRRANSTVSIEPIVADVDAANIEGFCEGVGVILDGTDNFETRLLLNDAAVKLDIPWIHAGCVGASGQVMTIIPGQTPCLRCLMQDVPSSGSLPTCETAGILGPAVGVIASIEAFEAIKILSGHREAISRSLTSVDLWTSRIRQIDLSALRGDCPDFRLSENGTVPLSGGNASRQDDCPCCGRREFAWLSGKQGSRAAVLCGRNAVQLSPRGAAVSLDQLAARLEGVGGVVRNAYLVRLTLERHELTIFADGRAIISGTDDPSTARALYAKYIGA